MQKLKLPHIAQTFVLLTIFIIFSFRVNADKNPTGIPLDISNYYEPPRIQDSYNNEGDQCIADPSPPPDTIVTPGLNDGRPYYDCRYNFTGLKGPYFKSNDTYYPCLFPELIGTVKVGEPTHKELDVIKGVHQSFAAVYPSTTSNWRKVYFTAGLVHEGLVIMKNTSIPYDLDRNLQYYQTVREKIELRKTDTTLYSESQVEQAKSIFSTLTFHAEKAEIDNMHFNLNRPSEEKLFKSPHILSVVQTFSTLPTRSQPNLVGTDRDLMLTAEVFGLEGARIEFQEPEKVADTIFKLINSSDPKQVNHKDLGDSHESVSAAVMGVFDDYAQSVQEAGYNFLSHLHDQSDIIVRSTRFNFKAPVPPVPVAYCNRKLNLDPAGHTKATNMANHVGMGVV